MGTHRIYNLTSDRKESKNNSGKYRKYVRMRRRHRPWREHLTPASLQQTIQQKTRNRTRPDSRGESTARRDATIRTSRRFALGHFGEAISATRSPEQAERVTSGIRSGKWSCADTLRHNQQIKTDSKSGSGQSRSTARRYVKRARERRRLPRRMSPGTEFAQSVHRVIRPTPSCHPPEHASEHASKAARRARTPRTPQPPPREISGNFCQPPAAFAACRSPTYPPSPSPLFTHGPRPV